MGGTGYAIAHAAGLQALIHDGFGLAKTGISAFFECFEFKKPPVVNNHQSKTTETAFKRFFSFFGIQIRLGAFQALLGGFLCNLGVFEWVLNACFPLVARFSPVSRGGIALFVGLFICYLFVYLFVSLLICCYNGFIHSKRGLSHAPR